MFTSQMLVNAAGSASSILIVALGFHLVLKVGRFFHFAHGAVFAMAPYVVLFSSSNLGLGQWSSILMGAALGTLSGVGMEICCYRPLRALGASSNILLLASLGIYTFLVSTLAIVFGEATVSIRTSDRILVYELFGARWTPPQLCSLLVAGGAFLFLCALRKWSGNFKLLAAVASDPDLATIMGVPVSRIYVAAMASGSLLASLGGILSGLDFDLNPGMGMRPLMMAVVAVIVGGNSISGTAVGAILIGFAQHLSAHWISPSWQEALVFTVLVVYLLVASRTSNARLLAREAA